MLQMAHPEVPTCDECCEWLFDDHWRRLGDTDRDRRDPSDATPCHKCPKIPQGEPPTPVTGRQAELNEDNAQALRHYLRCKATGTFPEDSLVEQHAAIIRQVEDQVGRMAMVEPVLAILAAMARRR